METRIPQGLCSELPALRILRRWQGVAGRRRLPTWECASVSWDWPAHSVYGLAADRSGDSRTSDPRSQHGHQRKRRPYAAILSGYHRPVLTRRRPNDRAPQTNRLWETEDDVVEDPEHLPHAVGVRATADRPQSG